MARIVALLTLLVVCVVGCDQATPEVATPQPTREATSTEVPASPTTEPTTSASSTPVPSATATTEPTPEPTATETPEVEPTFTPPPTPDLTPTPENSWLTGDVWVFPGPEHYVGDVLSFEVPVENYFGFEVVSGTVRIDDGEVYQWEVQPSYNPVINATSLIFPNLFEATEAVTHTITLEAPVDDGRGPGTISVTTTFAVLPADQRPAQEQQATWESVTTECCIIHYVSNTAAARDIESLSEQLQESVEYVEEQIGAIPDEEPYEVVLLDIVWGNGAYAGDALVASYVDRDYFGLGTENMESLFRHEATHLAASSAMDWSFQAPGFLGEGIAVYVAGGHYQQEPIAERAAAMYQLGYYVPIATLAERFGSIQHELRYLESAAVVAYIVEKHGWEGFEAFVGTELEDEGAMPRDWLEEAFETNFDLSLEEAEADFLAWLQAHEPGEQVEDLRLTVALSNTRRQYQREYAPYQALWTLGSIITKVEAANVVREPSALENVALETMLGQAQAALVAGDYEEAEAMIGAVQAVLDDGDFSREPVADYLAVAQVLAEQGYEAQQIAIEGERAEVEAIRTQPTLEALALQKVEGTWRVVEQ